MIFFMVHLTKNYISFMYVACKAISQISITIAVISWDNVMETVMNTHQRVCWWLPHDLFWTLSPSQRSKKGPFLP